MVYTRFKIFGWRIVVYARKVEMVEGVNSDIDDDSHMIFVDCDDCNIRELETEVQRMQRDYRLGDAYICATGREDSYHVYFLTCRSWNDALAIVNHCRFADRQFISFSVRRGHFTLRLSDKNGRAVLPYTVVRSSHPNNCMLRDLANRVTYETGKKKERNIDRKRG